MVSLENFLTERLLSTNSKKNPCLYPFHLTNLNICIINFDLYVSLNFLNFLRNKNQLNYSFERFIAKYFSKKYLNFFKEMDNKKYQPIYKLTFGVKQYFNRTYLFTLKIFCL